jgi:hypothetical protein
MTKIIDLTGIIFGDLKVIEFSGINKNRKATWLCECKCGNKKIIVSNSLINQLTRSCGCKSAVKRKHGMSNTRLYSIWQHMRQRCGNPKSKDYELYGLRGIRVCNEWDSNFINFYTWAINNGYTDNLSIDRKNVNGNYEPKNCRWASDEIQSNNKRTTKYLTINGTMKCLKEWSNISGNSPSTIRRRLSMGLTAHDAVFLPISFYRRGGLGGENID